MSRLSALFTMSVGQLRATLGRTLLSCLSLLLGILSLIAVTLVGSVAQQALLRQAELVQGRQGSVTTTAQATPTLLNRAKYVVRGPLLGHSAFLTTDSGAFVRAPDQTTLAVVAYAGSLSAAFPFLGVPDSGDGGILVNQSATSHVAPGQAVSLFSAGDQRQFQVKPQYVVSADESQPTIFIPIDYLASMASDASLTIWVGPTADPTATAETLSSLLGRTGIVAGQGEAVDVKTQIAAQLRVIRLSFLIVGLVTLGVGILGVLNIGLVTLHSRSVEFSLRRSIGATGADVAGLVLADTLIIGILGSLLAIAISIIAYAQVVRTVVPSNPPDYPVVAAVVGVAAGVAAGLLGGLAPAIRAARLPIASAMRA